MMFFRKPQPTFHPVYTMAVCALAVIGAAGVAMAVKNRMGCKIRKTAADAMKATSRITEKLGNEMCSDSGDCCCD